MSSVFESRLKSDTASTASMWYEKAWIQIFCLVALSVIQSLTVAWRFTLLALCRVPQFSHLSAWHMRMILQHSAFSCTLCKQKRVRFATISIHSAVTSFSSYLRISGPDNVRSVVVEGLGVVPGDILRKVQFLTVTVDNSTRICASYR